MGFLNASNKIIKSDVSEIDAILEQEEMLYAISECIINYRKNKNLTQKQLAKILKVNQTMISKLESGTYNPTFIKIQDMCRKLTNSSEMFIELLENIKKAIQKVTEKSYETEIRPELYLYTYKDNEIIMKKYNINYGKNGEKTYGEYQSQISAIG